MLLIYIVQNLITNVGQIFSMNLSLTNQSFSKSFWMNLSEPVRHNVVS